MQRQCSRSAVRLARPCGGTQTMDVVDLWTGRRASALRASLRMSNEAFAARLGAGVRTVANWEANPDMVLSPGMQEVLDAALKDAEESVQRRFGMLLAVQEGSISANLAGDAAPTPQISERPSPDAAVQSSQTRWREVRQYL